MILRLAIVLLALCLSGCASPGGARETAAAAPGEIQMPSRQVVVVLAATQRAQWQQIEVALAVQYRLRALRTFPLRSIDVQCIVYEVPPDQSLDSVVQRLRSDPRVDDAQPNRTFSGLAAPDAQGDSYASLQWGRRALATEKLAPRATGKGIKVAIVDTGADTRHPDLRLNITETVDLVTAPGESFDADHHGTAVAGIIAAGAGNRIGIVGVAPEASLMILKACRQNGQGKALCLSWTLARAIDAAILGKARVINLSLSGPNDPLVARLVRRADAQGIVVVAAAQAQAPSFPADMAEVMGVLASDSAGRVDAPTWRKAGALISAPGIEVITTVPGGSYDFQSGSSLSCAHISGLVALLLEAAGSVTPQAMRAALMRSLAPLPGRARGEFASPGAPDALAALRALTSVDPR
jgi:subtilisin family serine protease